MQKVPLSRTHKNTLHTVFGRPLLTGRHLALPDPSAFGHFHPLGHVRHTATPPYEKDPGEQGISVELVVDGQ